MRHENFQSPYGYTFKGINAVAANIVGGGGFQTCGLSLPVGVGQSFKYEFSLCIVTQADAMVGGLQFRITSPANSGGGSRCWRGPVGNVQNVTQNSSFSTGAITDSVFCNFNINTANSRPAWVTVETAIYGYSAPGVIDLLAQPVVGTDNFLIIFGSKVTAFAVPQM